LYRSSIAKKFGANYKGGVGGPDQVP
jgi:hypothetical protein